MCTIVIDFNPKNEWPVIIGANRDEMIDRSWVPPSRNWPHKPSIFGGLDLKKKGSWLSVNDDGVIASIANKNHTLGPHKHRRSRGEIVINALKEKNSTLASKVIENINPKLYQDFNLLLADKNNVYMLENNSKTKNKINKKIILPGVHIITSKNINDLKCNRIAKFLPLFQEAERPQPSHNNWDKWISLLSKKNDEDEGGTFLNIYRKSGFGTVSSSLIAINSEGTEIVWLYSNKRPSCNSYIKII